MTATEVLTWIAFGKTATRGAMIVAGHEQLERWHVRPMEHLREALVGRASPHPYCAVVPIRLPAGTGPVATHYACKSVSPNGPALLRSIRAAARRRLGRLVSYPELLAMLEQEIQRASAGDAALDHAGTVLMDALRRGTITAHGIPSNTAGDPVIGARYEPVPLTVLMDDRVLVDTFDLITIDPSRAKSEWMQWQRNTYHHVKFQTADVLALWPVQSPPPAITLDDLPADWTLLECVAWIMLRDPGVVRDTAPETMREAGTFHAEQRLASGTRLTTQTGEPGNGLLRLNMLWAAEKVENPGAMVWPGGDATKELLAMLRAGKLAARGRTSGGVAQPMSPADWRGLMLHEQPRGTLLALPERTMGQRWFDVTVPRAAVVAWWPAREASTATRGGAPVVPSVSDRTGMAGRPSSRHLVVAEYLRRHEAGEARDTIVAEARDLSAWLAANHPGLAQMTEKTVSTAIRPEYRRRNPLRSK